ncbi:WD40/YVTN/BNR-like repeat-containing protein [Profundibacterium mesophilum]|uniref:Twin arginine translocation signal domain containing protein n=1 Tax=Profundibacterium mesophilum KAUST100406-0324 TaxID=1037889 RepID=A0A921TDT8_9RHOB|nr:exo-alpha-sialidase [Profundibacterium mesophilum]KAF0677173.1 Twin arginine translocation signal domain containing protein [Profundibacterium mesophilum KAUST100406-0324]
MSVFSPRDLSRRRFLGRGLAAFCAPLILPRAILAAPDTAVRALAFDAGAPVVATRAGLWRLHPEGAEKLPLAEPVTCLASHPRRAGALVAALAGGGLRRSADGGQSWSDAAGLPDAQITALTIAALEPDMIYAALEGDGLWRSRDAGETWEFVMDRPYLAGAEHDVLSLVSLASPTGMGGIWLYAGTKAGLTRVPDCFCRWQDVTAGGAMDALAAGRTPPPANPLPEGEPVGRLALAPETPLRLYAGLRSGLWASADAGVNWTLASAGAIEALAVDPGDPNHLVAGRAGGLSVSDDGGATWTLSTSFKDI